LATYSQSPNTIPFARILLFLLIRQWDQRRRYPRVSIPFARILLFLQKNLNMWYKAESPPNFGNVSIPCIGILLFLLAFYLAIITLGVSLFQSRVSGFFYFYSRISQLQLDHLDHSFNPVYRDSFIST
jgi:hypothetical protein